MTPSAHRAIDSSPLDSKGCSPRVFSHPQTPAKTPNFDPIARAYRWMEFASFGPFLARCRFAFLGDLFKARNALILGDGDGRFTARLLRTNPSIRIRAIDASPAMLNALVRRAGPLAARVQTEVADARCWAPPMAEPFDLVVSHFFLDCLTTGEIQSLATGIRPQLAPNARWVVSEFALPHGRLARTFARPLIAFLYLTFGLLTGLAVRRLPDHPRALNQAGFTLLRRRAFLRGLLVSEVWSSAKIQSPDALNSSTREL